MKALIGLLLCKAGSHDWYLMTTGRGFVRWERCRRNGLHTRMRKG